MDGSDPDAMVDIGVNICGGSLRSIVGGMDGSDPDAMVDIGVNICGGSLRSIVGGVMDDFGVAAALPGSTARIMLSRGTSLSWFLPYGVMRQTALTVSANFLNCLDGRGGVDGLGWLGGVDGLGEAGGGVHGPLYTSLYSRPTNSSMNPGVMRGRGLMPGARTS
jgi:hypothetical protein